MTSQAPRFSILERVLAYTAAAIIAVAVLSYFATLIVALVAGREALAHGLWQFVTGVAFYGVPAGFVLVMVVLGLSFSRRSRSARADARSAGDDDAPRE